MPAGREKLAVLEVLASIEQKRAVPTHAEKLGHRIEDSQLTSIRVGASQLFVVDRTVDAELVHTASVFEDLESTQIAFRRFASGLTRRRP